MITDKLRSYGAAKRQIMPTLEHRSHKGLNNRAENSHLPLRNPVGRKALFLQSRVSKTFGSLGVATFLNDLVEHITFLIDSPP